MYLIYGLVDPRTKLIHYVGKSSSGLRRPQAHRQANSLRFNTPKNTWIRDLRVSNMSYSIAVLEVVDTPHTAGRCCWWWTGLNTSAIMDAERWWIAYGRASDWPLTNQTDGGLGPSGRKHSAETRARMSAVRKGKKLNRVGPGSFTGKQHSAETRAKLRAARLGKTMSPESSERKRAAMTTPAQRARLTQHNPASRPELREAARVRMTPERVAVLRTARWSPRARRAACLAMTPERVAKMQAGRQKKRGY